MESLYFDKNAKIETSQGDLPHWNQDGKLYFVTFRLADSMPQSKLAELREEKEIWLKNHPLPWDVVTEDEYHYRFSQFVDRWLDADYGSCILRDPKISTLVENAIRFHNHERYVIHAYVIMPNHVHVLLELCSEINIQKIMHTWKSFTANQINEIIRKKGHVWWRESFDRIIRNRNHYENVKFYILKNIQQGGIKYLI